MSGLLCCLRARRPDMGAALSHPQEGEACDGGSPAAPTTMADVIRERKKKAGGAGLGTLRRRIANATRRPRDNRPDRGCEHARYIRSVVSPWRLADVFLLCEELEAGAALRDLVTQAELAREPAPALHMALPHCFTLRWWCDVELVGSGWSVPAHRAILAARSTYFRDLLQRYPPSCVRVPLEGACASLPRAAAHAQIHALYGRVRTHCKSEGSDQSDCDLDLVDNTDTCPRGAACGCGRRAGVRRAAALFGATRDPLATSMRYLLDSGEMSDARLVFHVEGGAACGFRAALELPCHRVILAARSRFFRNVMSRRSSNSANNGAVCVDEKILPRRFARALLHAAYTDQVDLSLIGRNTSLPAASSTSGGTPWSGVSRSGASSRLTVAGLDDAFQLYEIGRFLEMPIVVQGCEDAVAEALTPETLPHVLRWTSAPHASQWLHRQAMRYLRDEFVSISSSGATLPRAPLVAALSSPFLQASEPAALRAILRWAAERKHKREPAEALVGRGGRGARRRSLGEGGEADALAPLLAHVRTEHMAHEHVLLQQLIRRGIVPTPGPPVGEPGASAHAWLGRGSYRPARCFLPYLDELKALLEDQAVPEAELARARRARYMHRIPDTLYMVSAARQPTPPTGGQGAEGGAARLARACVGPRAHAQLRARVRELRAAPPARRAAVLQHHRQEVNTQIALRAVREMSLPDACADLLLDDLDDQSASGSEWESPGTERRETREWRDDCCRTPSSSGSLRRAPGASREPRTSTTDNSRTGTGSRREQPTRTETSQLSRGACPGAAGGRGLSAAVPDVAMAPNANTHLLTARDYFRHPPPWEYGGVVLQLDLGDGATHTPRPGSRAQRNSATQSSRQRDHAQVTQAMSCLRARADEDELRAAIELSVMRAYSSFQCRSGSAPRRATLPPGREPAPRGGSPRARGPRTDPPLLPSARGSPPAARRDYALHPRDYRVDNGSFGSASTSRGHSPNNYA